MVAKADNNNDNNNIWHALAQYRIPAIFSISCTLCFTNICNVKTLWPTCTFCRLWTRYRDSIYCHGAVGETHGPIHHTRDLRRFQVLSIIQVAASQLECLSPGLESSGSLIRTVSKPLLTSLHIFWIQHVSRLMDCDRLEHLYKCFKGLPTLCSLLVYLRSQQFA
jgi:hypothetical protein